MRASAQDMALHSLFLLALVLTATIVTKGIYPGHPSRTQSDNTTRDRYFRYEIQPEYDDYFGHQERCRARGGKLAEPSSVADLESMFNTTRDVGGRKKDIIFLIGIVMREKCDPATQRLNHSCWTFASNPKGKAAPWFFGTNWWGGSPTRQPDNYRNEGQKCTYYISSIWPGGLVNTDLEPLLPHGVVGDEVCRHKFRALCELAGTNTTEIVHTTERSGRNQTKDWQDSSSSNTSSLPD
mmetsp:Transcript_16755/g.40197  ORF Transcript_16755/g.40197 Transcript_16755/m.40197 type:complete len:239 (-) Transcript_16755:269-985(-)